MQPKIRYCIWELCIFTKIHSTRPNKTRSND